MVEHIRSWSKLLDNTSFYLEKFLGFFTLNLEMSQICMIFNFNLNLNAERLIVHVYRGHRTVLGAILQVCSTLLGCSICQWPGTFQVG